jgi:hypothetical protein
MTELTSFALTNGLRVMVEAPAAPGVAPASLHPRISNAEQTLRQALQPVISAAAEVIERFQDLPGRPEEVEIHFGVKLDGTVGAIIASAAAGTHLDVTLRWGRTATSESPGHDHRNGPAD